MRELALLLRIVNQQLDVYGIIATGLFERSSSQNAPVAYGNRDPPTG